MVGVERAEVVEGVKRRGVWSTVDSALQGRVIRLLLFTGHDVDYVTKSKNGGGEGRRGKGFVQTTRN